MSKSQRVRWRDLREVYRLSGECHELGADPHAWREHMCFGLTRILGAQLALYSESDRVSSPGQRDWLIQTMRLEFGWACDSDRKTMHRLYETGEPDMDGSCFTAEFADSPRARIVACREQTVDDRGWYNGRFFNNYIRPANMDDALMFRCREGNEIRLLALQRSLGEHRFERRQRRLLSIYSIEFVRDFGGPLARRNQIGVKDLSPRQRQVLLDLLLGASEKQIAQRLGLSPHTVHDYVKALHARFGARSRADLIARTRALLPSLSNALS